MYFQLHLLLLKPSSTADLRGRLVAKPNSRWGRSALHLRCIIGRVDDRITPQPLNEFQYYKEYSMKLVIIRLEYIEAAVLTLGSFGCKFRLE